MTQRDLPKVGPATVVDPPKVTASVGAWSYGLQSHITEEQKTALMLMAGLTVSPDVLEVNGNRHLLDAIDDDQV